jgi:signal transduction histidine kinase
MLGGIDRGCTRIDSIVTDLLEISEIRWRGLRLRKETVNLAHLARSVVASIAPTTSKHHIGLEAEDSVVVVGDRDRLREAIVGLIDNAIRYSPGGGDVEVAVRADGASAIISVRDRGVGIPKEKQARIFQPFYRAHVGTPYDYGGLGVRLYLIKELATHLGGSVWFESEEGAGSTFHLSVPLAKEAKPAAA